MFVYSVKFICGIQNPPATPVPTCTPVRQGAYATEINIHNIQTTATAQITKRVLLLVHNDSPVGLEPHQVKAQPFATIALAPDSATMDNCCNLAGPLNFSLTQLNLGFLEIVSNVALNVTAVYTATDLKAASISIDVATINPQQV
jgi:hypothetical protein